MGSICQITFPDGLGAGENSLVIGFRARLMDFRPSCMSVWVSKATDLQRENPSTFLVT